MSDNTAQIGIALHQWKRGKEYRRLIKPPPGYDLLEFDFAGQEFRWMAVASQDTTMLSLCEPGEDAHSYMGAQIAQIDYRELVRRVKAGEEGAEFQRKLGKFCVAEGELVLTDQGLVPIEQVSLDMRVWDGVEWVAHEGLVYQGEREVITYAGLTATPDHRVYLEDGTSVTLECASIEKYRLAKAGDGGTAVRFVGDSEQRSSASKQRNCNSMPLRMRDAQSGECSKLDEREVCRMPKLCIETNARGEGSHYDQRSCDGPSAEAVQCDASALHKPKRSIVQKLRGAWDSVQIWFSIRSNSLRAERATTPDVSETGYRPQGKQRTLRAREFAACVESGEYEQHTNKQVCPLQRSINTSKTRLPCAENTAPRGEILRGGCAEHGVEGVNPATDSREVVSTKLQTKRTYDLTNAGPHHRFTVSNYLISNCNLSFQYRVSSKTALMKARTDYEMDLDEMFIKQMLATYKATFPGIPGNSGQVGYWQSAIHEARKAGYAETFAGRRVQLRGSWTGRDAWPMESTAINYPIQGTGADQKYLALAVLRNLLPKYNAYFYMELHDGIFIIVPQDRSLEAGEVIQRSLSNLPYKQAWGIDLPIQFPVDGKISSESWGDLKGL